MMLLVLSEHLFYLLLYSFWIKFICLNYMRKLALNIQLVKLFYDVTIELWYCDLVLTDINI